MWGARPGFGGFPERADRLRWADDRPHLARKQCPSGAWSQQEDAVEELRARVDKLLLENAQLASQCESTKSRAAAIESRCEREQRLTRRLEERVAALRESKRKNQQSRVILRADIENSVSQLGVIHRQYEAARAAQLQRLPSADALSAVQAEGDGTAMALSRLPDQIPAQCELGHNRGAGGSPGSSPSEAGGGQSGAWAEGEAAPTQVDLGSAALLEARAELFQARGQWHSLRVEMETLRALEKGLESSLQNTQCLYSGQLRELSRVIDGLRAELEQVRNHLSAQRRHRERMLRHKTRLEREMAAYRRLLEREEGRWVRGGPTSRALPWMSHFMEAVGGIWVLRDSPC
ncbi:keratin-like protein KRT222 [Stigmatopora nigra]